MPEKEELVLADRLPNFYVGAVKGSDRQGSVEGKFHVAGPRGFGPRRRDLFGKVSGRIICSASDTR